MKKIRHQTQQRIDEIKKSIVVIDVLNSYPAIRSNWSDSDISNAITYEMRKLIDMIGIGMDKYTDYVRSLKWQDSDLEMIELNSALEQGHSNTQENLNEGD